MNILSICSLDYNLEQAKGIIYWINLNKVTNSLVLRLSNVKNIFTSYFLLFIYFVFLRWITFIQLNDKYDYIFVTGKSVVAQSIIIADQLQIPLCTVQKPFGYPHWLFKYQIIPLHDSITQCNKNNLVYPIAPNTYQYVINNKREKKISILLGGNLHNKRYNINYIIQHLILIKKKFIELYQIEIITSRRTPTDLINKIIGLGLIVNSKYGSVRQAYYSSEILIITDDSFCMISEAIQSGIVPYIITTNNINKRLHIGLNYLKKKKLIKYLNKDLKLNLIYQKENIVKKINSNIINELKKI